MANELDKTKRMDLAGTQALVQDTLRRFKTEEVDPKAPQSSTYTKTEVDTLIANFITASVNNLVNYYLKNDTYSASEVDQLLAAIRQFRYEVVLTLPTASAQTMGKIYLVPATSTKTRNVKDEFITIETTETVNNEEVTTYSWEQIGSTTVDLSGYYTSAQTDTAIINALTAALAGYTTTANLATLLAGKQDALSFETTPTSNNKVATMSDIPSVPSWALQLSKPTYTANEVGAIPTTGGTMSDALTAPQFKQTYTNPTTATSYILSPNVEYFLNTISQATTLTLGNPERGVVNEYKFQFDMGSTAYTISGLSASILWQGGVPSFEASKHYEISIKYDPVGQRYFGLCSSFDLT